MIDPTLYGHPTASMRKSHFNVENLPYFRPSPFGRFHSALSKLAPDIINCLLENNPSLPKDDLEEHLAEINLKETINMGTLLCRTMRVHDC